MLELSRQSRPVLALLVAAVCVGLWGLTIYNVVHHSGTRTYRGSVLITVDPLPISVHVGEPLVTSVHGYPDDLQSGEIWDVSDISWQVLVPPDGDARVGIRRCGIGDVPDATVTATFNTPGKYDITIRCEMTCFNGDIFSGTRDLIVFVSPGNPS